MPRNSFQNYVHFSNAQELTNQRIRLIRRHLARIPYDDIRSFATAGTVEYHQFFLVVCDSVEHIVNIFYDFLLQLHKATCKLLLSPPPHVAGTGDMKPLPDILKDLHTSTMTLCTSGPDVIPVASCQFSDNCNCRKRHQTRDPVHPVHDLSDERHKSDNRHCYHHGHSHSQQHHHHSRPNSSSHSHHINNDNMNHHLLGHDVVDGPGGVSQHNREREHHGHVLDLQSNNHHHYILHHLQQHDRSNHSENNNNTARLNGSANRQNLIEQPRVVVEVHQDNNSTSPQPAALSMNNSNANSDSDNNRSGSHGDIGEHTRGRLTVPGPQAHLRQSSPRRAARDVSPRRRLSHDLGAHGNHDVDHEIALALRNIGDNLDVRMRNHKEPSVQAVFGACKPTCGQLLVLYLRHHNVMGVTIGATLELLLKFNRM